MADSGRHVLLSIGAFFIIVVVSILFYQPLQIIDWTLILPTVIVLSGCWLLVLAAMQAFAPQKYERGAFSMMSWGLLIIAIGGGWFLYGYGFDWIYSIVLILVVLAIVAIVAALKRK